MLTKAAWTDRFGAVLGALLPWLRPDELVAIGVERWETMGDLEPEQAARCECDEWPPDYN
jgi:hypothetical protein